MSQFSQSAVTAVIGPTNTGKTHLAIERLTGHSSGMIGFPLRLLAREVYDRVVAIKGANSVALITGEERICPPDARWFLCTAESMPTDRDLGFVAIDEAQLGADRERGHVFTDRLLNARGRDETMILGAASLRPMIKALVPDAEIIGRPRFSTLSYAGARKLSRLPKRTAIVAFSAEEVYAVAEAIRRLRGGAAVVMGALSPRTRNAQVEMFQSGEVDYLVATDAIGMGLNMDVSHVAFASLRKFDGRRTRRLTVAEMAQIAGRAGRHQRDGTFGALHAEGPSAFTPEEILAIENHEVPRLEHMFWREGRPSMASIDALIADLERKPSDPVLRAAPEAVDLAVLKQLADEDWVRARARHPMMVTRLWAACGLPDFRKMGAEHHARFVARIFRHLSEGQGHVPHDWFAQELSRLDNVAGDVETIAGRISAARSWAYIAHRSDWLAEPLHWAERTRAVEERLSDALHDRLRQRFVDKRTTLLLRQIGADADALPIDVDDDGHVEIDGHPLGTLTGFNFRASPDARAADKRMLLSAAERGLGPILSERATALANAPDADFDLRGDKGNRPAIYWHDIVLAQLVAGTTAAEPRLKFDRAICALPDADRKKIEARTEKWLADQLEKHLTSLGRLVNLSRTAEAGPAVRAIAAALVDAMGMTPRLPLAPSVQALDAPGRKLLRNAGITIGALDLFDPRLLKPEAARWRVALMAARAGGTIASLPQESLTVIDRKSDVAQLTFGFRTFGAQAVRIDLVERIARQAHDARKGRAPFALNPELATSIGIKPGTLSRLMAQLGFSPCRSETPDAQPAWRWRGRPTRRRAPTKAEPGNAFAALADLDLSNG